ncbi:inner centromere protein-like [Centruroides vittatus]|uniref:inner centromere protein-like n=1 Tax=Centruroides vittatus TaxID=120091 RepID=UPI003510387A
MTPLQKSETFQSQLAKNGLSTGIKFTPKISSFTSTSKLLKNSTNHTSKLSSGVVKQTPQASLSFTSQRSLISRVMSLKQQMTPSVKEKICHDIIKKQQKEEEVLLKKNNLLKMKIEEQKRKREERMRKVTETRQKLELEKDQKRNIEISKEERSAKKEARLKQKQRETIKKKQLIRKQKQEEVKERKKKEEENRLQKLKEQTPTKSTLLQKAIHNSYQTKEVEGKADNEQLSEQDTCTVLNETYNKNEKDPESYEMTPVRSHAVNDSSDPDNYDIADLKSDDETDDEGAPRKKIPNWAQGMQLRASLLQQHCNPPDLYALFGDIDFPDLMKIFPIKREYFQKRTSSAVWLSHSFTMS